MLLVLDAACLPLSFTFSGPSRGLVAKTSWTQKFKKRIWHWEAMLICSDVGSMKPCDHEGCVGWKELEALEQMSFVAFLPCSFCLEIECSSVVEQFIPSTTNTSLLGI